MLPAKLSCIICFFNCFVFVVTTDHKRPGVRSFLTSNGLNYVTTIAVPILSKSLNNLKINATSANVDLFVGNLNYEFKRITVSEVNITDYHPSILNKTGLVFEGTQMSLKVNFLWSYSFTLWPYKLDHGSCDMYMKEISIKVIIEVGKGNKGGPEIHASYCDLNIGDFDIIFHGGASWLYNLFVLVIKDKLKDQLEETICQATLNTINNAYKNTTDEITLLDHTIKITNELVNSPVFVHNGFEMDFKAEFRNVKHPLEPPYVPEILPPITDNLPQMLYIWITAYTINTALFSYQQTGLLHTIIFDDDLADDCPLRLNTKSFVFIVPELYEKYPGKDMAIGLNSTKAPLIDLSPDQGHLTLTFTMAFNVVLDEKRLVNCFTLKAITYLKIISIFVDQRENSSYICGRISYLRTDIYLLESHIGGFELRALKSTINIFFQFITTRYVNVATEKGILLPMIQNVTLINPKCSMGKAHVLMSTDFLLQGNQTMKEEV